MTAIRPALFVSPFVFLVHDLEEILQVGRMNAIARDVRRRLPEPLRRPLARLHYTPSRMSAVVAPLLAAQVVLTLWRSRSRRAERLLVLVLAVRFLNGVGHIGEAVALRRYVPGVATSPAIMTAAALAMRSARRGRAGRPA